MNDEANKQSGQQGVQSVAFQQDYLAGELSARVAELRHVLVEKRAECLRLEGQIGEAAYWLQLVQTAQPVPQRPNGADAATVAKGA